MTEFGYEQNDFLFHESPLVEILFYKLITKSISH